MYSSSSLLLLMMVSIHGTFGQPTWKAVYGAFSVEEAWDAVATPDGGVAVVGSTGSFGGGSSDIYLFKVDGYGTRLWSRTIGGPQIENANAISLMPDGGFLIAGSTNSTFENGYDGLVVRTDQNGEVIWQRSYGGADWEFLNGASVDAVGNSWLVGRTYGEGPGGRAWLLKLDLDGEVILDTTPAGETESEAFGVLSLDEGGCILTGYVESDERESDLYLAKLTDEGVVIWDQAYGGDSLDLGRDVIATRDGGYSVLGSTRSFNIHVEQYHLKVDGYGMMEWERNWGQVNDQEGFEHVQLIDGRYASIGYVSQGGAGGKDMFLLISDEGGWFVLGQTQGGADDDFGRALLRMDGGYLMCGISFSYGAGSSDVFLVRTNEVGFTDSDQVLTNFDPISVQEFAGPVAYTSIYPNPSEGAFTIKADRPITHVRVLDGLGRVAAEARSTTGDNAFLFDLRSGTYTVVWTDRSGAMARSPLIIQGP